MTPRDRARGWNRWLAAWVALSLPGVGLGVLMWGITTLLVCVLALAPLVALGAMVADPAHDDGWRHVVRRTVLTLVGSSLVFVAAAVLGAVAPAGLLLVLPGFVVTMPPVLARLRGRRGPPSGPTTTAHRMTEAELCRAWRSSYDVLQRCHSPGSRAQLVALRQSYLDEVEVRNPEALQAWLRSGAHAAGGPDRFLGVPHDPA